MNNKNTIVYYHGPCCPDGTSSAWCVKRSLTKSLIKYCKAGMCPTDTFTKKNTIVFVDICPDLDYIKRTSKIVRSIIILDHHKSANDMYILHKEEINTIINLKIIIDITRAGCQITWDYFFENEDRPWFIDYVADRDLWKFKLPYSKEINASLFMNNYFDTSNFTKMDNLLIDSEVKINKLKEEGNIIIELQKKEIESYLKQAIKASYIINNITYNIWIIGNINPGIRSELGNSLVSKKFLDGTIPDFVILWIYDMKNNEWYISMRGGNNSPDLSIIAVHHGGGGHMKASGFTIKDGKTLRDLVII